ncbi:MAG TPA: methyltransferase, FxLD system [Pseudonocardiaceae bacterium]|nr:methyltransferase, FxLD system [Pseudonocardiaceae bacterium]
MFREARVSGTEETWRAATLREAMVAELRELAAIRSTEVAEAFLAVPRHMFAPGEPLDSAYAANKSVLSRQNAQGVVVTTVSAANIQAVMLEQARLREGMRVLEIGSGGYNAALIAELVGEAGEVTSVDIDPRVIARARGCLDAAGYGRVRTVVGDAEHGVADHAPYDRVIVTARAWDIAPAWVEQLARDGRIVLPLRLRGLTRSVVLDRVADEPGARFAGGDVRLCSFVPMQGAGAYQERVMALDGGRVELRLDADLPCDPSRLGAALFGPTVQQWSGVEFDRPDLLEFWVAANAPMSGILTAQQQPIDDGLVGPASALGVVTLLSRESFAYRMKRPILGTDRFETGVRAHGPNAGRLAEEYVDLLRRWRSSRRESSGGQPRLDVFPASTNDSDLPPGHVIDKVHTRVVISWP